MSSIKSKKIAAEMMRELSTIILEEARDELLKTVTITGCEVSNDLGYAKVYFTSLSNMNKLDLEKELKEASPFFRTELASRLDLRHTPILNFIFDDSIEYGNKIEEIIEKIHNN